MVVFNWEMFATDLGSAGWLLFILLSCLPPPPPGLFCLSSSLYPGSRVRLMNGQKSSCKMAVRDGSVSGVMTFKSRQIQMGGQVLFSCSNKIALWSQWDFCCVLQCEQEYAGILCLMMNWRERTEVWTVRTAVWKKNQHKSHLGANAH